MPNTHRLDVFHVEFDARNPIEREPPLPTVRHRVTVVAETLEDAMDLIQERYADPEFREVSHERAEVIVAPELVAKVMPTRVRIVRSAAPEKEPA